MKFLSICDGCRKRKLFTRQRTYTIPPIGQKATSQGHLCQKCAKQITKMIKPNESI